MSYAKAGASRLALCTRKPCPEVAADLRAAAAAAKHPEPEILELILDVTSPAQIAAAAQEVEAKWGKLDILVNNAGYMPPDCFANILDASLEGFEKTWEIDYLGPVRVTKAFLPALLKGEWKTVVNVVSVGALYSQGGGESYATAKFALCRHGEFLSNTLAGEVCLMRTSIRPRGR